MNKTHLSLLLPLLALGACERSGDDLAAEDGFRCIDTPTVISVDEATGLGFSAADILALAAGEHHTPIHWRDGYSEGGLELDMGPETGEGELTVVIAHDGGEIRFVESQPEEDGGAEGAPAECPDRVEIDVAAQVTTAGGALAETLATTLTATDPRLARLDVQLSLSEIDGSYQVTANDPAADTDRADLSIGLSQYGIHGSFTGQVELDHGDVVGVGFVEYATFPSAVPRCWDGEIPVPVDAAFAGFSGLDALALVNEARTYELSWPGAGNQPMTLQVTHDGAEACAAPGSGGTDVLHLGGTLALETEDGSIAASLPVRITASPGDNGELAQVSVNSADALGGLVPVTEFASTFGVFPTDLSAYDLAGVEFSGGFAPFSDPGSADGHLTLMGATDPKCSDEPGSGCPGYDVVEVAFGEWGNK